MTDAAIRRGNKPLDIKLLQDVLLDDDCPQLEFVVDNAFVELPPADRKHKKLSQQELEDRLKRYKELVASGLNLPDNKTKLLRAQAELEQEVRIRKIEQQKLEEQQKIKDEEKERLAKVASTRTKAPERIAAASKLHASNGVSEEPTRRIIRTRAATLKRLVETLASKADSSEKGNKHCTGSGSPYSEEIDHVNYPAKGKKPSLQALPISEGAFNDRVKNKSRVDSDEQAGPSSRQGLRHGQLKACHGCGRKVSPTNLCSIGTGSDCALYCPSCSQKQFSLGGSPLPSTKHRHPDDSSESSDDISLKKCSIAKRRRHIPNNEEPSGSVVELFSSDEDDSDTGDVTAVVKPLRIDQQKGHALRSTNAHRMEDVKLAYPSKDDPEAVEVEYHDLHRLAPMEFLNDTIIDFYIKYMQRPEFLDPEQKKRFHFFNSFFYKKLFETVTSQPSKKHTPDLSKLRKWTKGTNIFEKDYLFIPIHEKWHWSLAIVCNPGASGSERYILHLDSMSPGHNSAGVFRLLKMYLVAEWSHQLEEEENERSCQSISVDDFSTKKVQVPQQDNESDCGLFLLHYIQCFLQEAPVKFKPSDLDHGNLFGRNWFKPSKASQLRKEILDLLERLFDACGGTDSLDKEPIENMAVLNQRSDAQNDILQLRGHDLDHFGVVPEDAHVLQKRRERSEYAHPPGQSSTEYVSVESSQWQDISSHSGQYEDVGGLILNTIGPGNSASGHPTDPIGWIQPIGSNRSNRCELKGKARADMVEPYHSDFITGESIQVYVELGDVMEMDQADLK